MRGLLNNLTVLVRVFAVIARHLVPKQSEGIATLPAALAATARNDRWPAVEAHHNR